MSVTFSKLKRILRPRPHISGYFWIRNFGFRQHVSDESGIRIRNLLIRSPECEFLEYAMNLELVWTPQNPDIFFISWRNKIKHNSFPCAEYSRLCRAQCYRFFTSRTTVSRLITCRPYDLTMISVQFNSIETLRLRFFGISSEPQTPRSHVIRALPIGLRFEVHVCTARPRPRGKWFTARFFAP